MIGSLENNETINATSSEIDSVLRRIETISGIYFYTKIPKKTIRPENSYDFYTWYIEN